MKSGEELNEILFQRKDLAIIQSMIPENARVLDLGCGSGRLLKALKVSKHAKVTGVERDQQKLLQCVERGVPCIHSSLDDDLVAFSDNTYDFVILSRTIQAVRRPDLVLGEMLRIGKKGIVSFMNFGHINSRIQLMLGNMPVTRHLPRPWYDTQTIHPATICDFRDLCRKKDIKILREIPLTSRGDYLPQFAKFCPNLFASICIFVISR